MAIIINGILHSGKGKIGPVIMSEWKGIPYIKSYVIPKDPKTPAQLSHRAKIKCLSDFLKPNYASYIKTYFTKAIEGLAMSQWNKFFQVNTSVIDPKNNYKNILISYGDVDPVEITMCQYNTSTDRMTIQWNSGSGNNSTPSDNIEIYFKSVDDNFLRPLQLTSIERRDEEYIKDGWGALGFGLGTVYLIAERSKRGYSNSAGAKLINYVP